MKQVGTFQLDTVNECIVHRGTVRLPRGKCVDGVQDQEAHYPPLDALGHSTSDPNLNDPMHRHAQSWPAQYPSLFNETRATTVEPGGLQCRTVKNAQGGLRATRLSHPGVS